MEQLERSLQQAERQYQLQVQPRPEHRRAGPAGIRGPGELLVPGHRLHRRADAHAASDRHAAFRALNIDRLHEFFGRVRYTYRDFNSGDSFDGKGDESIYPLIDRYYYRFDLRRAIAASEGRRTDDNFHGDGGPAVRGMGQGLALSDQRTARGVVSYGPVDWSTWRA